MNDCIRKHFYGKPSHYIIEQLILGNIQFCSVISTENISDSVVAETVSNVFYSNHIYTQ